MRGRLFSFEGVDGVGKTTQVARMAAWLCDQGYPVTVVREPGGTPVGEHLRAAVLAEGCTSAMAEFLVFAAARAELVDRVVRPRLHAGAVVLADRFVDSSVAYQGFGRGVDRDLLDRINAAVVGDCWPDGTIWLDGVVHSAAPTDALERRDAAYFTRVATGFQTLAHQDPDRIHRVDACQSLAAVSAAIQAVLAAWLPGMPDARAGGSAADSVR